MYFPNAGFCRLSLIWQVAMSISHWKFSLLWIILTCYRALPASSELYLILFLGLSHWSISTYFPLFNSRKTKVIFTKANKHFVQKRNLVMLEAPTCVALRSKTKTWQHFFSAMALQFNLEINLPSVTSIYVCLFLLSASFPVLGSDASKWIPTTTHFSF